MDLSPDARLLHWVSRQEGCRVFQVRHCAAALRIGRSSYVTDGWPAGLAALWILVRRHNPTWSPRRIRTFLDKDLGLSAG